MPLAQILAADPLIAAVGVSEFAGPGGWPVWVSNFSVVLGP